jgi:predicted XRE-type DNA-binding protein
MKDAATILDALVRRGVTQKQIADAIGITQPNANKLYRPDRNGKLRTLSYDEGCTLIARFGLADDAMAADHTALNAATLAPILDALLPLVPSGGRSEKSVELLSQALAYGLALLGRPTASPPSPDAIGVAARGAVVRFREIGQA